MLGLKNICAALSCILFAVIFESGCRSRVHSSTTQIEANSREFEGAAIELTKLIQDWYDGPNRNQYGTEAEVRTFLTKDLSGDRFYKELIVASALTLASFTEIFNGSDQTKYIVKWGIQRLEDRSEDPGNIFFGLGELDLFNTGRNATADDQKILELFYDLVYSTDMESNLKILRGFIGYTKFHSFVEKKILAILSREGISRQQIDQLRIPLGKYFDETKRNPKQIEQMTAAGIIKMIEDHQAAFHSNREKKSANRDETDTRANSRVLSNTEKQIPSMVDEALDTPNLPSDARVVIENCKEPFACFGFSGKANGSALKSKYRDLAAHWHPDKVSNFEEKQLREKMLKLINACYEVASAEAL